MIEGVAEISNHATSIIKFVGSLHVATVNQLTINVYTMRSLHVATLQTCFNAVLQHPLLT